MPRAAALSFLLAFALPAAAQDRAPTHANVKYGPHERNVMDVWLAKSDRPTPVLVSIHGGGFAKGDKSVSPDLLRRCLDSGIAVAAITYRFSNQAIAPAQFLDAARAIQFLRHKAREWNFDPGKVAATGGSAGAGISLWLGFHDDLADPKSNDPVLRQSTRLTCMSVFNGQTSYDPRFIRDLLPGTDTYKHPRLAQLFAVDLDKLDDLPREKYRLFERVSPIQHLTKEDVPAQLLYAANLDAPVKNASVGIHHPQFGQALKDRMDKLGIECQLQARVRAADAAELTFGFIRKHFEPKPKLGEKFLPNDIDLARPVYETSFESADVLKGWRLEGGKQMSIANGCLILQSDPAKKGKDGKCNDHLVCWLVKELPADFMIEFTVRPANRKEGLNIVFFSTRGLNGESIFDRHLKPRDGTYNQYHSGDLNCYHISYWAAGRGTANLRKSKGFHLVAQGKDLIGDAPANAFQTVAFETVRVYKRGGKIRLMVGDVLALAWEDDGKVKGPDPGQSGWFGLRQMGHTHRCEYGHVKVYRLKP